LNSLISEALPRFAAASGKRQAASGKRQAASGKRNQDAAACGAIKPFIKV
jgi:hypothetical protein